MKQKEHIHPDELPTIALIGRVNVGKSTLFNRITDLHHAIVSKEPGTTRTRNISTAHWRDAQFRVIDTGGLTYERDSIFEKELYEQFEIALNEADLILFVVDIQSEPTTTEQKLAEKLRSLKKPIMLIGNKADNDILAANIYEKIWRKLGLGIPFAISGVTGRGVGDLLDTIIDHPKFPKISSKTTNTLIPKDTIKVALIGKPNVGKSSLFNSLIGQDRVIVSEIPHTTRETHDTLFNWNGHSLLFIDTAGIRRKALVQTGLERIGVAQSLRIIEQADINLFILDASQPISHQDKALAGLIERHHAPIIIIANKWDIAQKDLKQTIELPYGKSSRDEEYQNEPKKIYRTYLEHHFKFVAFAPIIFLSAKTKKHVNDVIPLIIDVNKARNTKIEPQALEDAFREIIKKHLPIKGKGVRHPKIYSIKQLAIAPPVFELAVQRKTDLHEAYLRYLERRLRDRFGFIGVPMVFYIKKVTI